MRVSIPEEVKKSQQIMAQKDRILAQAQENSTRVIALAKDEAEKLTQKDVITEAARVQAERIIADAKQDAEAARHESDEYVIETLTRLEVEIDRTLTQVRNGIKALQAENKQRNRLE